MGNSSERIADLAAALKGEIEGDLRLDPLSRALYATDASMYEVIPVGVLIPRSRDDVEAAITAASELEVSVLPRGGGSSLAGQTVNEALVIDCTPHLNRILDFDSSLGRVTVQPGITHAALNRYLAHSGWMMGPDPASGSRATIGGMLANNSTGTHSILYGNMIRHVHSAEVVLADGSGTLFQAMDRSGWQSRGAHRDLAGRICASVLAMADADSDTINRDMPPHWRRNNGYRLEELLEERPNPARLICGSEGTLAMATEVTVNLVRKPRYTSVGVVHFETRRAALRAVTVILETRPAAVELMDGSAIERCLSTPEFAQRMTFVEGAPGAILLTEYYGESVSEVVDALSRLERALPGVRVVRLEDPARIAMAWSVRREALGLIMGVQGDHKPIAFIEDASVPVGHLADYIDDLERLLADTNTPAVMYAHASAGCLHVRPFINTRDAAEVRKMEHLAQGSSDLVRSYGGWVSSEHGDGLARSWLNPEILGPDLYRLCGELKQIFDPSGILNPRRVVDAPPMTASLRMGPDYHPLPVAATMAWEEEGSFEAAVELCNGNGACRKLGEGTMCPSFMATRQEVDSTRGRANTLRMAMTGRVEGLTDRHVYEALDLCLQCKACKRECPSAVDMAKMKTEWLDGYWKRTRPPLRVRMFSELPVLARLTAGPLAPLANRVSGSRVARRALSALGIDTSRPPVTFAERSFTSRGGEATSVVDPTNAVALFVDTFSNFQHPEVPHAAVAVLEAAGFQVIPVGDVCCGRTYLSKGFVTKAQRRAIATVQRLYPFVEQGVPVVGLEPSCILTLSDEFLSLIPGDPRTMRVAEAAVDFETFVSSHAHRFVDLNWTDKPEHLMVHGHCHQKARGTFAHAPGCYSVTGASPQVIDAGCCGMAGSFGYEHGAVSRTIGEERLAPAIRAAGEEAVIAAAGTSCRAQIRDLTGREALHPAQVLARALGLQSPRPGG